MASKEENSAVFKMVIPAAGQGTRFLPITKAVPKEMLPLGAHPAVEYVMTEAARVGITQVGMITNDKKTAVSQYFAPSVQLREKLQEKAERSTSARQILEALERLNNYPKISFIPQLEPLGLGHAVAQAAKFVQGEPFVVALPDDIFHPEDPILERMLQVRRVLGGSVVALIKVSPEQATAYGSAHLSPVAAEALEALHLGPREVFSLSNIIEKPRPEQIRSEYGMVGRYVLDPALIPILENTPPGLGGEIQLTDALATAAQMPPEQGGGVWGVVAKGRRFDTGTPLGYTQAVVEMALENPDYGDEFAKWLGAIIERQ